MKNGRIKNICLIAIFISLIIICAQIVIPAPVPITLQLFAIFFALIFLDTKQGALTVGIYLLSGIIGLPVFAGFKGGLGAIFCPTGGFILGFVLIAVACLLGEMLCGKGKRAQIASLIIGLILCYTVGTIWFYFWMGKDSVNLILTVIIPLFAVDIIKLILAVFISKRLKKIKGTG